MDLVLNLGKRASTLPVQVPPVGRSISYDPPCMALQSNVVTCATMQSMKCLAIGNAKGGTGKTSLAVNLAAALAEKGDSVLLVDFDPQGSSTVWLDVRSDGSDLVESLRVGKLCGMRLVRKGIDLMPSGAQLATIGAPMLAGHPVPTKLKDALAGSNLSHKWVLIDCAPSVGPLVYNALAAADGVLVPCECSALALDGLADFENVIAAIRAINPSLTLVGVQPVRTNRTLHSKEALEILGSRYGKRLMEPVPDTVQMRDAAGSRKTIFELDLKSKAADSFRSAVQFIKKAGL